MGQLTRHITKIRAVSRKERRRIAIHAPVDWLFLMATRAASKLASGSRAERGRTVLRAYLNVVSVPPSPSTALFDATSRTGRAMDLAMRIRRHGRLSGDKLYAFASLANLAPSDLTLWCIASSDSQHAKTPGGTIPPGVARMVACDLASADELGLAL